MINKYEVSKKLEKNQERIDYALETVKRIKGDSNEVQIKPSSTK